MELLLFMVVLGLIIVCLILLTKLAYRKEDYEKLKQWTIDNGVAGHNEKTGIYEVYLRYDLVNGDYERGHKDGIAFEKERAKIFNE